MHYFFWILQIIIWISIIFFIIFIKFPRDKIIIKCGEKNDSNNICGYTTLGKISFYLFYLGASSYIMYVILEWNSSMTKFLNEITTNKTIINEIKNLVQAKPVIRISLYNINYYEGIHIFKGPAYMYKLFNFISCRDISGKLTLNSHSCIPKSFVLLKINYEIGFADNETLSDYEKKKKILLIKISINSFI